MKKVLSISLLIILLSSLLLTNTNVEATINEKGEVEYLQKNDNLVENSGKGVMINDNELINDNLENNKENIKDIDGDLIKNNTSFLGEPILVDVNDSIIKGVSINSNSPRVGEFFEIYVEVDNTLIEQVKLEAIIGKYNYIYEELHYDESIKKYKYSMEITEDMIYKRIEINSIVVIDKLGKETRKYAYEFGINDILVTDSEGNIDIKQPKFNGINISKPIVKAGESVDILVDTEDDQSGIYSVYIQYLNNYGGLDGYKLEFDESSQKYKMTINTTEENIYDNYEIVELWISDNAGNEFFKEYKSSDIDKYIIYVSDEDGNIDDNFPQINDIKVSKNIAKVGDKIKVSIDARDLTSGIKSVNYNYYYGTTWMDNELLYNEDNQMYEMEIEIDDSVKGKIITPIRLRIEDYSGHTIEMSDSELKDLIIEVQNDESIIDIEKPKLIDVKFDKISAKAGELVKVMVDAKDEGSGIKKVEVGTSGYRSISLELNSESNLYEGFFIVNENEVYTSIDITKIYIEDNIGNILKLWTDDFDSTSLKIVDDDGKYDNEKPILKELSMINDKFKLGERIGLKINTTDELSGVEKINIYYENSDGSREHNEWFFISSGENKVWISEYNFLYNDKYFITKIELFDKSGNINTYLKNDSEILNESFEVGTYLEKNKIEIKIDTLYEHDIYVTGTTSIGNVGIRKWNYYGNIQIGAESISNNSGIFKMNANLGWGLDLGIFEVFDIKTNEVLGYKTVNINKEPDINRDKKIDILDLAQVALNYGCDLNYIIEVDKEDISEIIYKSDINRDMYIDIYDLTLIARRM